MNGLISHFVRWLVEPAAPLSSAASVDPRSAALLLRACACVRVGELDEAEQLLESGLLAADDVMRLNLIGVLCERRGRWAEARRQYGRAIRADRGFAAAVQNLRRWFEMDTFGRTKLPLLLGDEEPQLWWLRRRAVAEVGHNEHRTVERGANHHDN